MTQAAAAGAGARALRRAEFFEVVRQLLAASGGAAIGDDAPPAKEPVRFAASLGLRHAEGEVAAIDRPVPGAPVRMEVAFMGLTGPAGVLPDLYSDRLVEQRRARDEATAHFLDLFNHRAISHFYRAWAKYRLPVRFGEGTGDRPDPFGRALAALAGLPRDDDDGRRLAMAGPLARRVRSPGALRRVIAALFDLPVRVVELQPRWVRIAPAEQTRLGSAAEPAGRFARLGIDVVAGASSLELAGRFRVRIGPLDLPGFRAFFEGDLRRRLTETVRFAVGPHVDFDLQLVLRRDAVPPMRLGGGGLPAALGQNGWVLAGPAEHDRDDAVLSGQPGSAAG